MSVRKAHVDAVQLAFRFSLSALPSERTWKIKTVGGDENTQAIHSSASVAGKRVLDVNSKASGCSTSPRASTIGKRVCFDIN